jgi:hypothetical protein
MQACIVLVGFYQEKVNAFSIRTELHGLTLNANGKLSIFYV